MSIENQLLYKLLDTQDWETVIDKGISPNYFSGTNIRAFRWIGEFKVKYGKLPDIDTFKKHFPEVSLDTNTKESMSYYCDEVGKKVRQNKLVAVLDKAVDLINSGQVDKCYEDIGNLLLEVNSQFLPSEKVDIGLNTDARYEEYETSKITGGMTGIPLGIAPIDKQTGGLKEVDLFTFLGQSGKGKSFLLCLIAMNLVKAGYKVLFLTKEMSPHQLVKRMDALFAQVSYSQLKNGQLSKVDEEQYKYYLDNIAPKYKSMLSIELVTNGVNECIAKVDAFKPEVVLVDGGYLMSEGADPEDWKAVISVWKAFKVVALDRKIPIIITSQLTDKNTIAYSTGLKQYCDGLYIMKQDEVQRAAKELVIENIKIRDGEHLMPFTIKWDVVNPREFGQVAFQAYDSETRTGFLVNNSEEGLSLKRIE